MNRFRTVVITGDGTGIGRALAVGFTSEDCIVIGLGRTASMLEETKSLCKNGRYSYKIIDVLDNIAVSAIFAQITFEIGPIDVLICNAAVYPRIYFLDHSPDEWTRTILTNVCGVANCCRTVLPAMLEKNAGRIVIIGSLADIDPVPASSAYSASKGALHALTRALSAEIDRQRYPNVLVNEFNPGVTQTNMSEDDQDPASVYPWVKRLVEFPTHGPTGRMFVRDKEFHLNEGLKAKAKRLVLRSIGLK
jgi:NAD(P)-dependent dehydrogenase (short-subunit alcohol dehydrogenase family)